MDWSYTKIFQLAGVEIMLAGTALVVLFVDLALRKEEVKTRGAVAVRLSLLGIFAGILIVVLGHARGTLPAGILVIDPLSQGMKVLLLILAGAAIPLVLTSQETHHIGELCTVLLLSAIGLSLMVSTENFLTMFVGLELASLSFYIATALNDRRVDSLEAALKYLFYGGVASAFLLYGLSLFYGWTGSIEMRKVAAALSTMPFSPGIAVALLMVLIGLGFKIAAVPFHLWAPDTYQAAPNAAAAWIASGSKLASFFLLGKFLVLATPKLRGGESFTGPGGWLFLLWIFACGSMILGNLTALVQRSFKRLLAYSGIAHAGYVLLPLVAIGKGADLVMIFAAVVFYVFTYGLAVIGAFGVAAVQEANGLSDRIEAFAGLYRRGPIVSLLLLLFLLSLAGIPPLAGFVAKFYLLRVVLTGGMFAWIGFALAIGLSVVALYYYLQVLKHAFVREGEDRPDWKVQKGTRLVLLCLGLGVLLLGIAPQWLFHSLHRWIGVALQTWNATL